MDAGNIVAWTSNWVWGLPMIVFTVILHAYSLSLLNTKVTAFLNKGAQRGRPLSVPSFLIGATALA